MKRSIPLTLALLFGLTGAGHFAGAITAWADDGTASATPRPSVTPDGIITRAEGAGGPETAEGPEAAAARIEIRQATEEMKRERARMEAAHKRLSEERSASRTRLAALFAQMPPEKAAPLLAALSPADAAAFIAVMPPDSAAKVIAALPEKSAVAVTQAMLTAAVDG